MCGILGWASKGPIAGNPESVRAVTAWRDRMAARGPDGSGLATLRSSGEGWGGWSATLAHRRLAVVETGKAGEQPMRSADGRWVIVYNGELYNDREVRAEISGRLGEAWVWRTRSDTETVLAAVATWGVEAARRLRGMYALAVLDTHSGELTLARDPLGIKPLFVAERDGSVFFASQARLAAEWWAQGKPRADLAGVAAYLTTIRTTLGTRTMYEGVRTLKPGEWATVRLGGRPVWRSAAVRPREVRAGSGEALRSAIERSVSAHLRSDVPLCCLLSGGLDSTMIAMLAAREVPDLRTFCAGAAGEGAGGEDFEWARRAAERMGVRHTEVGVTRDMFARRVQEMVEELGAPLSTPNEVAIHAVSAAMRAEGFKVTLSGEGADELFGGYDRVLAAAVNHEGIFGGESFASPRDRARHSASLWMNSHAWTPESAMERILRKEAYEEAGRGAGTRREIESVFLAIEEEAREPAGSVGGAVERHLLYQRRVNLEGLLRRLDSATMLAGVEGRTPFADAAVCAAAEDLPSAEKIRLQEGPRGWAAGAPEDSKIALRRAAAGLVPEGVLKRAKASFPLPMETWVSDLAPRMAESPLVKGLLRPEALAVLMSAPAAHWRLTWPLVNLAVWGDSLASKAPGFVETTAAAERLGAA